MGTMSELHVSDFMTTGPGSCTPHDSLENAARLMVEHDCGAIPIIDDPHNKQPVGIVTDRDIVIRAVSHGKSTFDCAIQDVMSPNPVTLKVDASFHDCARTMMVNRFRRILVVDDRGRLVGIVTDGDLARACRRDPALEHELAAMVEQVSMPPPHHSLLSPSAGALPGPRSGSPGRSAAVRSSAQCSKCDRGPISARFRL